MDQILDRDPTGRRRFLVTVGLAGLATTLGSRTALAQAASPAPAATPAPAAPAAPAEPEISEDARALAAIVQRRYGQHLDADAMKDITEELEFRIQGGKRLRGAALTNADEPDSTFHA